MTLSWMVAAPLAGATALALAGGRLGRRGVAAVACLALAASFLVAVSTSLPLIGATFPGLAFDGSQQVARTAQGAPYLEQELWTWFATDSVSSRVSLRLDALATLMALVITGVGLLIHLYAAGYMAEDPDLRRFFCYLNLFVGAMLVLVLADNLVLLYLGWEGVGLCSYLLIGFWYREPANGAAARKAFVVTRVGDAALALGLFLLARELGTLRLPDISGAAAGWSAGDPTVALIATLLLVGAIGKSAQVPLQVWLPDAMAGPTPVSALIHAATMVTAGVYLIARTHEVFLAAPDVMAAVAAVGTVTAFTAACAALVQRDIKRVLAYSTISQIGYMFAALGVGAWVAAMFHFMTHAFFKALLFLSAGIVTHACHGETDLLRMGALRRGKRLPGAAALAAVGAASLAGVPLITSGFYSKDAILWRVLQPPYGSLPAFVLLLVTAGITALYSFRWFFLIFAGRPGPASEGELHRPGALLMWPCVGLAAGSLLAGFFEMPETFGGYHALGDFLGPVFGATQAAAAAGPGPLGARVELLVGLMSGALSLLGLMMAYQFFILRPAWLGRLAESGVGRFVGGLWRSGWAMDALYEATLVRPFLAVSSWLRADPVDDVVGAIAGTSRALHHVLTLSQTGRLRGYAAALVFGAVLLLTLWLWS